jgi:hypothetical protein
MQMLISIITEYKEFIVHINNHDGFVMRNWYRYT